MNPTLKRELDKLGATLAARREGTPPFTLVTESATSSTQSLTTLSAELDTVVHKENLPTSIQETVASFSARQVARVAADLRPLARRIYALLHLLGCEHANARAYHPDCTQLSFFLPGELVYTHLGLTRGSFYRSLRELKALGLVDVRGHKTTINGWQVRCDGSLWCVKLFPTTGKAARLRFDDLKASYRDLAADIREKRTVWEVVRQSYKERKNSLTFSYLLSWTLSPGTQKSPVTLTVASRGRPALERLLDIPLVPKNERGAAVDRAARSIAAHLSDNNLGFYRFLLWQLLRLHDTGQDHLYTVYAMVVRAGVDRQEGFARCAGALFVSRLKASGLWAVLESTPRFRVS